MTQTLAYGDPRPMHHDVPSSTGLFMTNAAAAGWWVADLVVRHGPSWETVPPLLIGIASIIGAAKSYANDRQMRRHREEKHRLELGMERKHPRAR